MHIGRENIYPDVPVITRMVEVGGLTKSQLIQKLQQYGILMNESGERLFADVDILLAPKDADSGYRYSAFLLR